MKKAATIFLNAIPVIIMVGLIPLVPNDYVLAVLDVIVIALALIIRRERHEISILFLGLVIMAVAESFFIATGVETFTRRSLFGIMPLWLPILWSYGFVAIKRGVEVLRR